MINTLLSLFLAYPNLPEMFKCLMKAALKDKMNTASPLVHNWAEKIAFLGVNNFINFFNGQFANSHKFESLYGMLDSIYMQTDVCPFYEPGQFCHWTCKRAVDLEKTLTRIISIRILHELTVDLVEHYEAN